MDSGSCPSPNLELGWPSCHKPYLITPHSTRDTQSKNTHLGSRQGHLCVDHLIDNSKCHSCVSRTIWSIKSPLRTEPGPLPSQAGDTGHVSYLLALPSKKSGFWGRGTLGLVGISEGYSHCPRQTHQSESWVDSAQPPIPCVALGQPLPSLDLSLHNSKRTDQRGCWGPLGVCLCGAHVCRSVWAGSG